MTWEIWEIAWWGRGSMEQETVSSSWSFPDNLPFLSLSQPSLVPRLGRGCRTWGILQWETVKGVGAFSPPFCGQLAEQPACKGYSRRLGR